VVHVVYILQSKDGMGGNLKANKNTRNPNNVISDFLYFCSAIEQLIYLFKYDAKDCSAYKYLIRMIDGLRRAGALNDRKTDNWDDIISDLKTIMDDYKSKSTSENRTTIMCDYSEILKKIVDKREGGRRNTRRYKRKYRKTRKHKTAN
jgi:hypothetical protein